jgi:hypothetical protein
MKNIVFILILVSLGSCKGQEKDLHPEKETGTDTVVKPKGQ